MSPSKFGPLGLVLAGATVRERNWEPEKRTWRKMSLCQKAGDRKPNPKGSTVSPLRSQWEI